MHSLALHHPYVFRKRHIVYGALVLLVIALIIARLYLGVWLTHYVNRVLDNIPGYQGSVEDIGIDLYRGAYRIHGLKILKKAGNIPVPFVAVDTADLSIQWGALFHGRIVSNVDLVRPVINFAVSPSGRSEQTGGGVDWSKPIQDLMPIDINLVTFSQGKITYQDFSTEPKVNIYINNMSGEARNLRNVVDTSEALPSTIVVQGDSIGKGRLHVDGRMNILPSPPNMRLNVKLEKVNLPALSDYTDAYAGVDIEKGTLNVYSEFNTNKGQISGYIKPLATNIHIIDLNRGKNPIQVAWEVVVAAVVELFTNQRKDQFATRIPLSGNLNNIKTDTLATIVGIIRNAFIQSFKKGFDAGVDQEREE